MDEQEIGDTVNQPGRTVKPFLAEIADMAERGLVRIEDVAATARTVEDRMAIWGRRVAHEIDTFDLER